MPSFDVVSKTDMQEVDNAVNGAKREIENRFDFKGGKSTIERKEDVITLLADDDMKLKAMQELLRMYLTRRKLDARALDFGKPEAASGNMVRQEVKVKQGIDQDTAKSLTKAIKESKIKVQASIRGDELRVEGKKRDDLQQAMALLREMPLELPLQYVNMRD